MLSLLRLACKQKNSLNLFRIRIFLLLSYSFGIETINTFIHSRSSLENHILDSRPNWAKCIPIFRPKRRKKPPRWGGAYLCSLYKRVPPTGRGGGGWTHSWFRRSLCFWQQNTVSTGDTRVTVITQPFTKARLPFISYDDFTLERG